jgi:uncharacterized membrane protein
MVILAVAVLLYGYSDSSLGAFLLIGPFPIVFGAGPGAAWLVLFYIIFGVLMIIMTLIMTRRRMKRTSPQAFFYSSFSSLP